MLSIFRPHTLTPPSYQLAVVNIDTINSDCSNLYPGESLCLGWSGEDCSTVHVVRMDDTCDEVAADHGINTTMLYFNNPQLDSECSNLYIGEVRLFLRPRLSS